MVGAVRFELTTSCTRNKRASQATLRPDPKCGRKMGNSAARCNGFLWDHKKICRQPTQRVTHLVPPEIQPTGIHPEQPSETPPVRHAFTTWSAPCRVPDNETFHITALSWLATFLVEWTCVRETLHPAPDRADEVGIREKGMPRTGSQLGTASCLSGRWARFT